MAQPPTKVREVKKPIQPRPSPRRPVPPSPRHVISEIRKQPWFVDRPWAVYTPTPPPREERKEIEMENDLGENEKDEPREKAVGSMYQENMEILASDWNRIKTLYSWPENPLLIQYGPEQGEMIHLRGLEEIRVGHLYFSQEEEVRVALLLQALGRLQQLKRHPRFYSFILTYNCGSTHIWSILATLLDYLWIATTFAELVLYFFLGWINASYFWYPSRLYTLVLTSRWISRRFIYQADLFAANLIGANSVRQMISLENSTLWAAWSSGFYPSAWFRIRALAHLPA